MPLFTLLFIVWLVVATIIASRCVCSVHDIKKKSDVLIRKPASKSDQRKHWINCLSDTDSTSCVNYKVTSQLRRREKRSKNNVAEDSVSVSEASSLHPSPVVPAKRGRSQRTGRRVSEDSFADVSIPAKESEDASEHKEEEDESEYSVSDYCAKHKKEFFSDACVDCEQGSTSSRVISCTIPTTTTKHRSEKEDLLPLPSSEDDMSQCKECNCADAGRRPTATTHGSKNRKEKKDSESDDSAIVTLKKNERSHARKIKKHEEFSDFSDFTDKKSDVLYEIPKGKPGVRVRKPCAEDMTGDDFGFDSSINNVMSDLNKTMAEIDDFMGNVGEQAQDQESDDASQQDDPGNHDAEGSETDTATDTESDAGDSMASATRRTGSWTTRWRASNRVSRPSTPTRKSCWSRSPRRPTRSARHSGANSRRNSGDCCTVNKRTE
jgi:hypothetical protein